MEIRAFFERGKLLNLKQLRQDRPDWTDRLPVMYERPTASQWDLVKRHWSFYVPADMRDAYNVWKANRRHRRNLEQIEIDELNETVDQCMIDDTTEALEAIRAKHEQRREASRFHVATRERRRVERLARRWDVECPKLLDRGEVNEDALAKVRRSVRDARWTFIERCAKTLIPVLSLLVALAALLRK